MTTMLLSSAGCRAQLWCGHGTIYYHLFLAEVRYLGEAVGDVGTSGRKVVLWVSGSNGITLLNMLGQVGGVDCIEYVVDINTRKHGTFVAGTHQEIVPPQFLKHYRPDTAIVMNPLYMHEVAQGCET